MFRRWQVAGAAALVALMTAAVTAAVHVPAVSAADAGPVGGPLPAGWEICVLEDVGAPVTAATVADLDEWQIGEGGSTENDNLYNPFNTRRFTDPTGAALPAEVSSIGFPAFATWPAGCAATAATILQPNMAPILDWLVAGGASSPAIFLSVVDQTPWCAPDDGQPCYALLMALQATPPEPSPALVMLAGAAAAVSSYENDGGEIGAIEYVLAGQQQELVAADAAVTAAQQTVQTTLQSLRSLAVYDYTSNPSLDRVANLSQFEAASQNQELTQYYEGLDLSNEVVRYHQAQSALHQAQAHSASVAAAIVSTEHALGSAQADQDLWASRIASDVDALHDAGACPGAPAISAGPSSSTYPEVASLSDCLTSLGS